MNKMNKMITKSTAVFFIAVLPSCRHRCCCCHCCRCLVWYNRVCSGKVTLTTVDPQRDIDAPTVTHPTLWIWANASRTCTLTQLCGYEQICTVYAHPTLWIWANTVVTGLELCCHRLGNDPLFLQFKLSQAFISIQALWPWGNTLTIISPPSWCPPVHQTFYTPSARFLWEQSAFSQLSRHFRNDFDNFRREGSPTITCWPPRWLATSPRSSFCCNDHCFCKRSAFSRQSANFRHEGTPAITCWPPRWPRFHQHLLVGLFCILRFGNWTVDFNCSRIPRTFSHNYTPPSLMQSSQWIILKI